MQADRPGLLQRATASASAAWAARGICAVAVVWLLEHAERLLAPIVVAVVMTFVLAPLVRRLQRRGLPAWLGAGVVITSVIACTAVLTIGLAAPAAVWWQQAPVAMTRLMKQVDRLRSGIPGLAPPTVPTPEVAASPTGPVPPQAHEAPPADPVKDRLTSEGLALTGTLVGRLLNFSLATAATVILLYFLLASEHWLLARTMQALQNRRAWVLVLGGVRSAQRQISRYVVSLSIINVGVGIVMVGAMQAVGLPNPLLWGAIACVLNFVPYLGPLMIVGLLLLAGSVTFVGVDRMLLPALAFIAIHAVESNIISPWLVGRRLRLSPVSVFLAVMFWGWLWGIVGALVAVPMLLGLRIVCRRHARLRWLCLYLDDGQAEPWPRTSAAARGAGPMGPER